MVYVNGDGMDTGVFSVVAARVLYFFSAPPPLRRGGQGGQYSSPPPPPVSTLRMPLLSGRETSPARSITSTMRAARL